MSIRFLIVTFASLTFAGTLAAAPMTYQLPEESAALKDAAGVDVTRDNCSACHSADYISTQPPMKGKDFWTAEVNKMIKVYAAPIKESDVDAIASYLATNY